MQLIRDYKNNDAYRKSFNRLAQETFGIDFEQWYRHGFWNDRYICYSYASAGEVVANVSANRMDLIMEGKRVRAVQIGTVMTRPEYRNRGLSYRLMEIVLREYEAEVDFIYLFVNPRVLNYYPKFGFVPVNENEFSLPLNKPRTECTGVRKLDMASRDDMALLARLSAGRVPVSRKLGVENGEHLLLWYGLNIFPSDLYYWEDRQVILIARTEQRKLIVFDVVSLQEVRIRDVLYGMVPGEVEEVVFHFTPDFADAVTFAVPAQGGETLFVRPAALPIGGPFKFPATAQA